MLVYQRVYNQSTLVSMRPIIYHLSSMNGTLLKFNSSYLEKVNLQLEIGRLNLPFGDTLPKTNIKSHLKMDGKGRLSPASFCVVSAYFQVRFDVSFREGSY